MLSIFLYALLSDCATGLGALPFFFIKKISRSWLGIFNGVAAGFMLGASLLLLVNGVEKDWKYTAGGMLAGFLLIILTRVIVEKDVHVHLKALTEADFKKTLLLIGVMTLHSFAEGIGIGVSFSESNAFGLLIALSIAIQNIPEGLAIALVLCPEGIKPWQAVGWSIFTSLPQPFMAVIAYVFIEKFESFLPAGLGFAAGAMIWIVISELLPDGRKETSFLKLAFSVLISAAAMYGFTLLF